MVDWVITVLRDTVLQSTLLKRTAVKGAVSESAISSRLFVVLVLALGLLCANQSSADNFSSRSGKFSFEQWQGKSLDVHYQLPTELDDLNPNAPILFVMTGRKRNAEEYRDQWRDLAIKYGFIVLVPEFKWDDYPDEVSYDMGGTFRFEDRLSVPAIKEMETVSEKQWAFSALEPLFDVARNDLKLSAKQYSLYGHSSGAGFVHRYLYYKPKARLDRVVAANGAWYLLPRADIDYPYGLEGSRINKQMLQTAFRRNFTVMFGQNDLGPRRQYHANTEQANAQGPHVVSRAMSFMLMALVTAKQLDTTINWSMRSVPNVGHSNTKMAPSAVEHLFPDLYFAFK